MGIPTVFVPNREDFCKQLQSEIDRQNSNTASVVASFDWNSIPDLRAIAVVRLNNRQGKPGGLDCLFPDFSVEADGIPEWVTAFYFDPSRDQSKSLQTGFHVYSSLTELAAAISDWVTRLSGGARPEGDPLRRADLEDRYRSSIYELRLPEGSTCRPGDELVYIPSGTDYSNDILEKVRLAAQDDRPVLLRGPHGCGKEILARLIADLYFKRHPAKRGRFIAVNAAHFSESLRELIGVSPKAATGVDARESLFQRAKGGVLFIDEIATLETALQDQLLRVLSSGDYQQGGGSQTLVWQDKLITATNESIESQGDLFRGDLFQRLKAHYIVVKDPTTLDYDDKRAIVHGVIFCTLLQIERRWGVPSGKPLLDITEGGLTKLVMYNFQGSIRELRNVTETTAQRALRWRYIIDEGCIPALPLSTQEEFSATSLRELPGVESISLARVLFHLSDKHGVKPLDMLLRFLADQVPAAGLSSSSQKAIADKLQISKEKLAAVLKDANLGEAAAALKSELGKHGQQ